MAYRSPKRSSWRQLKPSQVLPIWTTANSNAANLVVQEVFAHLGITDIRTYFQQLRIPIAISVIVCTLVGASNYGLKGVFLGGLLGLAAPAALIWLGVMLTLIVIFMAVYCAAWAVILWVAWWLPGHHGQVHQSVIQDASRCDQWCVFGNQGSDGGGTCGNYSVVECGSDRMQ